MTRTSTVRGVDEPTARISRLASARSSLACRSLGSSPLVWPGYDPTSCAGVTSGTIADTTTCTSFLFIPDKYTGVFDNMGAFREPSRLTANLALGYEVTPRVKATLTLANLLDRCSQRGEPWDAANTCIYAQIASNLLAPAGNFVANPPAQLISTSIPPDWP